MEKRKPHYPLTKVKQFIKDDQVEITMTSAAGGAAMGFATSEMLDVVSNLTNKSLYKSMTSHVDHTVWHDVYHADTQRGSVYLKLTIAENLLIISFKEKDE